MAASPVGSLRRSLPEPLAASVLGMRLHATSYAEGADVVCGWAGESGGRYVCVANVHMVMEARGDPSFLLVVNEADLVAPDGMPLVWLLRRQGIREASRVYGPTLTEHVCAAAARAALPVGFYGGTPGANAGIVRAMQRRYPDLNVAYAWAPPFRALTEVEDARVVTDIVASGARILFVGLGCPKQEWWMHQHRDRLPLVQLGVGAAFAFHAGEIRQAPSWLQRLGLEWAFRLAMEPRRLWKRYLVGNMRFLWHVARERAWRPEP